MLSARNINDVLVQATRPVPTTDARMLASAVLTPSGGILASYCSEDAHFTDTKLKMFALYAVGRFVASSTISATGEKYEVDDLEVYLRRVAGGEFLALFVCEGGCPPGVVSLKLAELEKALKELERF